MDGKADLHLHSTYSDGAHSVTDLLTRAGRAGLTTVSITDHDHVGAYDEAFRAGAELGLDVIPGVELSATYDEQDIHLLGYFIDPGKHALQEFLSMLRAERLKRAERMVEKLNRLGLPLRLEAVLAVAGKAAVGRPHVASALWKSGLTGSFVEAFVRYIGTGKPAYEGKHRVSPAEAVEVIAEAGGLSFIAHPGTSIEDVVLRQLIADGVDGIEVIHPSHSPERVRHFRGVAGEFFLLASGGSDFHGGDRNDDGALGNFTIPTKDVEVMRQRLP